MFKTIGALLVAGWGLLALIVVGYFLIPKVMAHLIGWMASYIVLIPVALLIVTGIYGAAFLYRLGMRRRRT